MSDLVVQESSMMNFIERASRDDSIDVAKLEALLRMQREVAHEQAVRAFNQAMAEAQAEMMPIIRNATNPHTQSRYAKFETIDGEMRPIYTRHGFSVRYGSGEAPQRGWVRITCTVAHTLGYYETNYLDAPPDESGTKGRSNKTPVQGVGSSVSYLRRYLLCMSFNIVLADDPDRDGERWETTRDRRERSDQQDDDPNRDPWPGLSEANGTAWLRNLTAVLAAARSATEVTNIGTDQRVRAARLKAPTLVQGRIDDLFKEALARLAPTPETTSADDDPADPIAAELLAVGTANLEKLDDLATDADWLSRLDSMFPPDRDRLVAAITARKTTLQRQAHR